MESLLLERFWRTFFTAPLAHVHACQDYFEFREVIDSGTAMAF